MNSKASAKPTWHSDESWEIETLEWRDNESDFERLVKYAVGRIRAELAGRGVDLHDIATHEVIRQQVKNAAIAYEDRHKRIGLASHVTLWLRGFIAAKMRGEEW
jgi:hypothetical protein